ncbi:glycosyltransferase family 2 protein [Nocardioides zhouii]|uniref:Glycosyltransferase family 2 protein n=1 Tax=Nocardioides zhouii TaxID=1168729 RepID=A0A4V1RNH1_9ACTN|nr:glycosyltransferase family A protein [Nocardioides zhouii]RYC05837.1 glycosyltransferase family 2 protein [Nocardioides zhouii]
MTSPRCSVVIPTYNGAHVIGEQLAALCEQDGAPPFEVVVADNGSTDDLAGVVTSWQERLAGLRRVDASRAQGVSVARNVGIDHATSDLILICDADDRVSPGWVAAMTSALADHPLVSGPVETALLSGRSASWVPIEQRTTQLFETWEGRSYGIGCNLGLRREVWEQVGGFDEHYPAGGEEIDFAWRAGDLGYEFAYVAGGLIHYRIRTDLRGVLRQQYNSGRGTAMLYARFRPTEVVPKSTLRRIHHELLLLKRFPWRGGRNQRRMWLTLMAFEAGKLVEARRQGVSAP